MSPAMRLGGWCVVLLASVSGCTTARFVSVDNSGAIVAIPNNTNCWPTYNRQSAEELMHQKFPQGYVIDHEEEVVTGTTTHTTNSTERKGDPALAALKISTVEESNHQTTYTTEDREWRIWCHAADAPPPPTIVVPAAGPAGVSSGTVPVPGAPIPASALSSSAR